LGIAAHPCSGICGLPRSEQRKRSQALSLEDTVKQLLI
jgi:hypothetical protein